MKIFAEIKNDKVVRVIVASQQIINKNYTGEWIETKKTKDVEKDNNFASTGDTYDRVKKKFIKRKPKIKDYVFELTLNNKWKKIKLEK